MYHFYIILKIFELEYFQVIKKENYDDLSKSSIALSTNFRTDAFKSGYESFIGTGMLSQ